MDRLGPYRILRKLGEGGMGVVYLAEDDRLARRVAIKTIRAEGADAEARRRFEREARLAAGLSHPNICQLHEVGEADGMPYIVMELLDGEPLSARIGRGALPAREAIEVTLAVLGALAVLHARGLVHRDLKPSNVFLTPHGVKLLDFGLARAVPTAALDRTDSLLTQAGAIVGTPHYMAPEQLQGRPLDARSDLFAVGSILFELLAGRKAFGGTTMVEVFHATLYEQPPALGGSPGVAALDRIVRRALAKKPEDRYADAEALAADLRAALGSVGHGSAPRVVAVTRLIVLPFRPLRPDPETDFLAVSLPDALTSSLSGLDALVVRSSLAATRLAGEVPDFGRIAREADVDVVLTGTLLRGGDQLRVSTQLVEAPAGTVLWSHTAQAPTGDVFRLEDELVHRIVDALAIPLTAREHRQLQQEVPASPRAYELYLRANPLALQSASWDTARGLYEECVREDPRYAPAWARLGRVRRLLAKYVPEGAVENLRGADEAFRRALALRPELPLAHALYAQHEVEAGHPREAMARLLALARQRSTDADLFRALVHACRYCGLLEASLGADEQARRLDPHGRTSVSYTHLARGDFEAAARDPDPFGAGPHALATLGRVEEACAMVGRVRGPGTAELPVFTSGMVAAFEGRNAEARAALQGLVHAGFRDPEGLYTFARVWAHIGEADLALEHWRAAVRGGFHCLPAFERDPWMATLRDTAEGAQLLAEARAERDEAARVFAREGGEQLLGVPAS